MYAEKRFCNTVREGCMLTCCERDAVCAFADWARNDSDRACVGDI